MFDNCQIDIITVMSEHESCLESTVTTLTGLTTLLYGASNVSSCLICSRIIAYFRIIFQIHVFSRLIM